MRRSTLVSWVVLAGLFFFFYLLNGRRGGFTGYLISFGIVVVVSGAFRLGPFKALLWTIVAAILIGLVGGYLGVVTGHYPPQPNFFVNALGFAVTAWLFYAAIALILGLLIVRRWRKKEPALHSRSNAHGLHGMIRGILLPLAIITYLGFGAWAVVLEFQYLGLFWLIVSFIVVPISFFLPVYVGFTGGGWTMALVTYGGGLIGTVFLGIALSLEKE
jgi:hypothetical protein